MPQRTEKISTATKHGVYEETITRSVPSQAALAFANRLTEEQFRNIYTFANLIDAAFENALAIAVEEERQRILGMGFGELMREFWRGRKLRRTK